MIGRFTLPVPQKGIVHQLIITLQQYILKRLAGTEADSPLATDKTAKTTKYLVYGQLSRLVLELSLDSRGEEQYSYAHS